MAISAGGSEGVNLGLIITPMLDMAFQLLAFFVMTYHPSAVEGHIDGKLLPPVQPPAIGGTPKDKDVVPQKDPDIDDIKDKYFVIIKAVPHGQIRGKLEEGEPTQIQLKRPESPAAPDTLADVDSNAVTVKENGERVLAGWESGLDTLKKELERIQKNSGGAEAIINIQADGALHHGFVVRAYDVCKLAGFKAIGFAPP